MHSSLYGFILKHSKAGQIKLIILSLLILPIIYITLELPKMIINVLNGNSMVDEVLGYAVNQTGYLMILSGAFLLSVLVSGAIKYFLNVYRGILGEKLLRRLRFELFERVLRFPLPHFKRVSSGEIVPMITAETEPLAEFIGESYTLPVFQGGMLITYVIFIFQQDIFLGFASISLYPIQLYLIPKLQSKVNELSKERVKLARNLSGRIGQSVSGIVEVHANDTTHYERAIVSDKLGSIFNIRSAIYQRKFFIKFLNNFIAQLTPFFFYAVGGYFVIKGELSIGALVAVLVAYKDLAGPWKELLRYYQRKEDIKTKYNQIIEQFNPPNLIESEIIDGTSDHSEINVADLQVNRVSYSDDGFLLNVDGVSFAQAVGKHYALVGLSNSGKDELTNLASRLINPSSGKIHLGDKNMDGLAEKLTDLHMGYVAPNSYLFGGSIRDNLLYALKHEPSTVNLNESEDQVLNRKSTKEAGGANYQLNDEWVNLPSVGIKDEDELQKRIHDLLCVVELKDEVFQFGLVSQIQFEDGEQKNSEFVEKIMQARTTLRSKLAEPEYAKLFEPFDHTSYNTNMSAGENLLFGTLYNDSIDPEKMAKNEFIKKVMDEAGLTKDFIQAGIKVTEIMVDLFSDIEPNSEIFEQFSFINADDLPHFQMLLKKINDSGFESISEEEQLQFISLPFKLTVARHRLGLINPEIQQRILQARLKIREGAKQNNLGIEFLEEKKFNPQSTVQDNILFGKLAYGQANAQHKINFLIKDVIIELGLQGEIFNAGLDYEVGVSGSRLSSIQRQKLGLARSLLKRPQMLVVNESISGLDTASERRIIKRVRDEMDQRSIIWSLSNAQLSAEFDQVLVMDHGHLVANDPYQVLETENSSFQEMIKD